MKRFQVNKIISSFFIFSHNNFKIFILIINYLYHWLIKKLSTTIYHNSLFISNWSSFWALLQFYLSNCNISKAKHKKIYNLFYIFMIRSSLTLFCMSNLSFYDIKSNLFITSDTIINYYINLIEWFYNKIVLN